MQRCIKGRSKGQVPPLSPLFVCDIRNVVSGVSVAEVSSRPPLQGVHMSGNKTRKLSSGMKMNYRVVFP